MPSELVLQDRHEHWKARCVALTGLVGMLLVAPHAVAQPRIRIQEDLTNRSYQVRVVNKLDITIYYKLVGGRGKSYAHQTLKPGQSERDQATGGEKVLCVWDMNENVILAAPVLVDRSGKIVIGDFAAEAPAGGPALAPKRAASRLEIVPE